MRLGLPSIIEDDDTWPRMSPFHVSAPPLLCGGQMFNLLVDVKEEHAMMLVKQPQIPVPKVVAEEHIPTFKAFASPMPIK